MEQTDEYFATTGGGNRVRVTVRSPVKLRKSSLQDPLECPPSMLSPLRIMRRRKPPPNPVAAHYSPKPLESYLSSCMRTKNFDEVVAASSLVTTPSRWRRGPGGSKRGFRSDRQDHVGAAGFGLMSPGAVGAYVRMEPGKAILLPKLVKRAHFKPATVACGGVMLMI